MVAKILISPNLESRLEEIDKLLSVHLRGGRTNHPDLLYIPDGEKLGIGEARKIKDHFVYKPNKAKGKVAVLESADNLTPEAQNALLKTIEELPEHALLILGASSENNFLPTVLSRCQIVHVSQLPELQDQKLREFQNDIEKLLVSDIQTRFEYIETLKDREEFLITLVQYFYQNLPSHMESGNTDYAEFLKELLEAEKWAKSNVSIRGILEYLMLIMPIDKQ